MTISGNLTYNRYRVRRNTTEPGFVFEARNDQVSQTLLIPGLSRLNPNNLFAQGQPGGWADPYDLTRMWIDDAGTTPATIASLGTGIGRVITKGNAITLTQANAADRPVWGRHPVSGIRNLLQQTEALNISPWQAALNGSTVTPNTIANPLDGQLTGDTVFLDNQANSRVQQAALTIQNNTTYTLSAYVKNISITAGQTFDLRLTNFLANPNAFEMSAVISLSDGTATVNSFGSQVVGTPTVSVVALTDGWFRVSITGTTGASALSANAGVLFVRRTANSSSFYAFGVQLEIGPTATPYQRVTNRFDITETGVPSLYYFSGNGVNQSWASNATVNFTGTDKVTVWAGVTRLSNLTSVITELGSGSASNTFTLFANRNLQAPCFRSRGSADFGDADSTTLFPQPATNSLVGVGRTSTNVAQIYVNSVLRGSASNNQGSGNYANATLHVFSRGGSSLFYNGLCYSLIIAGDNYDSRTIQRFSDWLLKPRRLITA